MAGGWGGKEREREAVESHVRVKEKKSRKGRKEHRSLVLGYVGLWY